MPTIEQQLNELIKQKAALENSLRDKGVEIGENETLNSLVPKVLEIETGVDTSDATATASDILTGETAYVNGEKITGTMEQSVQWNTTSGSVGGCNGYSSSYTGYTDILKYIKTLDLSESKITSISGFSSMPIEQITLPSTLTSIAGFSKCTNLKEIILPDRVTIIGVGAFKECTSLKKAVLSSRLTTLGSDTTTNKTPIFEDCTSLTEIEVPCHITNEYVDSWVTSSPITKITFKPNTYTGCSTFDTDSLRDSGIDKTQVTEIVFKGITKISSGVESSFLALQKIFLDKTLTYVGASQFNSYVPLTDVYYAGTEEEWNAINIGTGNDNLLNATIHYNYTL